MSEWSTRERHTEGERLSENSNLSLPPVTADYWRYTWPVELSSKPSSLEVKNAPSMLMCLQGLQDQMPQK
ncbi:hypothetical protein EYF80_013780 [Liparis tanakae]|uniref:Uncharacterized protein n=1 Tax=Liparis tanakae TaxID=230148 RepID=A0A4Z2IDP0_9TELE|nr:hypothetical protein EYF80_013780 [Liparis tanakae]